MDRKEGQNNGNKEYFSRRVGAGILTTGMLLSGAVVVGSVNEAKAEIIIPGEMPSQKGNVLDQLVEKSVASAKAETETETIVGLRVIEKEKNQTQPY